VELKEAIWYTIGELVEMLECPGCGISMVSFKNRFAHVKKCFSIKRRGPLYRIYGYAECKCGLLIADTVKAQKLHCCSVIKPRILTFQALRCICLLREKFAPGSHPNLRNISYPIVLRMIHQHLLDN